MIEKKKTDKELHLTTREDTNFTYQAILLKILYPLQPNHPKGGISCISSQDINRGHNCITLAHKI